MFIILSSSTVRFRFVIELMFEEMKQTLNREDELFMKRTYFQFYLAMSCQLRIAMSQEVCFNARQVSIQDGDSSRP